MAQTLSTSGGQKPQLVSFPGGEGYLAGHLYLPEEYEPSKRYPAVAIGGSFASVKEQMGAIYGQELASRGVMALAVDYRNYGQSGGAIRQYEDPDGKGADLSAALRFLRARSDVSGTGLLGVCTSGGTVLYTAAEDPNVGAVATVAGFFSEPALQELLQGSAEGVEKRRAEGRAAKARYDQTVVVETILPYSDTDKTAANFAPMEYYMDKKRGGGGVREWRNEFAVMSWGPDAGL